MREFVIGPEVVDENSLAAWRRARKMRDEDFKCEFCDHEFVIGDTFACTYSNFSDQRGGNPITCEKCFSYPWEKRLLCWKLMGDKNLLKQIAREKVFGIQAQINSSQEEPSDDQA